MTEVAEAIAASGLEMKGSLKKVTEIEWRRTTIHQHIKFAYNQTEHLVEVTNRISLIKSRAKTIILSAT
jgi:hypothetical protein